LRSLFLKKGVKQGQPFLPAAERIVCREGIGQFLKLLQMTAFKECIGTLLKIDAFGAHAVSQPVVLIETNTRRKRQIGTDANEHATPALVVNVKVVLHDLSCANSRCQRSSAPIAIMMRAGSLALRMTPPHRS
jgi:hypothetical protein